MPKMDNFIDLGNPSSYKEAGERLINQIDLNNIQKTSYKNFIRNIIPRYMNKIVGEDYTLYIEEYFLDDSEVLEDRICRDKSGSQELALRAVAKLVVNEMKVSGVVKLPESTFVFPFLVTKIPILSEKGSFLVNGVDRVLISHLEKANTVLKSKDMSKPLAPHIVTLETGASKKLTLFQAKGNLIFNFRMGNDGSIINVAKGIHNVVNTKAGTLLSNLGIDKDKLTDIVGFNPVFQNEMDKELGKDQSIYLDLFDLTSGERYMLNRKLSFRERLSGKIIAEDVVINGSVFVKKGSVVTAEEADHMQNSGITRVMIKTSAGPMPLLNNGFVRVDHLIDNKSDIPASMEVKSVYSDEDNILESYVEISKPELDVVLSKGSEGRELRTILSLETNRLIGLHLTANDIYALLNMYSLFSLDLKDIEDEDDIDSLRNKTLANVTELFEALLVNRIYGKIGKNLPMTEVICIKKQIETAIQNYRHNTNSRDVRFDINLNCSAEHTITRLIGKEEMGKLFQRESNINPLDEINHRRRISLLKIAGRGGVPGESNDPRPRSVNPSHLGRICCIESPEGKTIGLVLFLASLARVNSFGAIEAPYFKVDKKRKVIDYSKPIYLSYDDEINYTRAMTTKIADRDFATVHLFRQGVEVVKYELEPLYSEINGEITLLNKKDLEYEAERLFRENDLNATSYKLEIGRKDWFIDENVSAVKGDGIPCQAKWDEIDFVVCRGEHILSAVTASIPFSENNDGARLMMGAAMGKQNEPVIGKEIPLVRTTMSSKIGRETNGVILAPCDAIITGVDSRRIELQPLEDDMTIEIQMINDRISSEKTMIATKPLVKKGEMVLKGQVIADNSATLQGIVSGGTNLCVAYGHWDGYNFEDAITINDRLVREDIFTSFRLSEYTLEVKKGEHPLNSKTMSMLDDSPKKASELDMNGCIAEGSRVKSETMLIAKILPKSSGMSGEYKTQIVKYHSDIDGVVLRTYSRNTDTGVIHTVVVATKEKVEVGDKAAGRHGNKGIISRIEPSWAMPRLEDGTIVDILLTPQGIPSRMNIGQLDEAQIGLILKELGIRVISSPNSNINLPEMKALLNAYTGDEGGKMQLYDGRTGEKYKFKTTVGFTYISKLKHLAAHKIHARGKGNFNEYSRWAQPKQGKAANGGQRAGEMEMWALHAHGAQKVLAELQIFKSDDPLRRDDFESARQLDSYDSLSLVGNTPIPYRMAHALMTSLNINMKHIDNEGNEIDLNKDRCKMVGHKEQFKDRTLSKAIVNLDEDDEEDNSNYMSNFMSDDTDEFLRSLGIDLSQSEVEETIKRAENSINMINLTSISDDPLEIEEEYTEDDDEVKISNTKLMLSGQDFDPEFEADSQPYSDEYDEEKPNDLMSDIDEDVDSSDYE